MISVRLVTRLEELEAMQNEWRSLAQALPWATPFQTPDWLLPWWRHFGSGRLWVFVCRDSGRLKGVAPFFLLPWQGRRQLSLVGSGISDYLDPLMVPEFEKPLLTALAAHLTETHNEWDCCDWQDLAAGSALGAVPEWKEQSIVISDVPCSRCPLGGGWLALEGRVTSALRRSLQRGARDAAHRGIWTRAVSAQFTGELFDALARLHAQQWQRRGQPGMIEANHAYSFLLETARHFAARNALRLYFLELNREVQGVILGLAMHGTLFAYLSGVNPDYEDCSLPSLLVKHGLQMAIGEGLAHWDFLRGQEPYKSRWGTTSVEKQRVVVHNRIAAGGAQEDRNLLELKPI